MAIRVPFSKSDLEKHDNIRKDTKDDMRNIFGTFKVEDYMSFVPTYKTISMPIKKKYSTAIQHFYEQKHKPYHENVVQQSDIDAIEELKNIIKNKLENEIKPPVFVRLSTRSPKDAVVNFDNFKDVLEEEVKKNPDNESLAMIKTQKILSQCFTPDDVINHLINSERVYNDFIFSNLFNEDNNKQKDEEIHLKSQSLLLREFDLNLNPELEFRCFVKYFKEKKELRITGITQYFKLCYIEYIAKNKNKIEKIIRDNLDKAFEKIKKNIQQSFVIDVGVDYDSDEMTIIELNPFSLRTGGCFFDWSNKKDKAILEGESEFEFRVLEKQITIREQRKMLIEKISSVLQELNPLEEEVKEKEEKERCSMM